VGGVSTLEFLDFDAQGFINGIWRPDLSPWRRSWWDDFLGLDGQMAGAPKWQARAYVAAVKLYPVNWFKNF
jgi:hypothetical protein